MTRRNAAAGLITVGALLFIGGCTVIERSSMSKTSATWNYVLSNSGPSITDYDLVFASDPGGSRAEGYRLWEGSYRGVPIEMYSKGIVARHYLRASKRTASLWAVDIVLVARDHLGRSQSRTIVDEKRFDYSDVDVEKLVKDTDVRPSYVQELSIGRLKAQIQDRGGGRLAFTLNALKNRTWHEFDLETVLSDFDLVGEKRVVHRVYERLSPKAFAEKVISATNSFPKGEGQWWSGGPLPDEIRALDHPLWESQDAVKAVLQEAPARTLVHSLKFMWLRENKDPYYLASLQTITPELLALAEHPAPEVRRAFGQLPFGSVHWPVDLAVLEALLSSGDNSILTATLGAYWHRNKWPSNLARVKELSRSHDGSVADWARSVLELAQESGACSH